MTTYRLTAHKEGEEDYKQLVFLHWKNWEKAIEYFLTHGWRVEIQEVDDDN